MAEGWLRHLGREPFEVRSAGTAPQGLHPMAVECMRERGIDISSQRSKSVDEFNKKQLHYVITVCDHAQESCPTLSHADAILHWSFPDPAKAKGTPEERIVVFREVRDAIEARVQEFLRDHH